MFRAVIFDFDGVITDSEVLHLRTFNHVLAQHDVQIASKNYYKNYLGLTDVDCFRELVKEGRLNLDEDGIKSLVKEKNIVFEKLAKTDGKIIEGVRYLLEMLSKNNIPMAICSGALLPEIELILEEGRLRSFFEVIVSAEQVKKNKPDPEGFLLCLERLNSTDRAPIQANECVVIEDSQWGLKAAKNAGMHMLAVTNSYDAEELTLAEKTVENLNELTMADLKLLCGCSA